MTRWFLIIFALLTAPMQARAIDAPTYGAAIVHVDSKLSLAVLPNGTDQEIIAAAFSASNKRVYLEGRTYTLSSTTCTALSNAEIIGIPGQTVITGIFGNALIRMCGWENVYVYGVKIDNEYVSATEDAGKAAIYSWQNDIKNVTFDTIEVTSPKNNGNGIIVYQRINSSDTSATLDGLTIKNSYFHDIGRIAVATMNRYTGANTEEAMKHIDISHNKFANLGLAGTYGIAVSLDGAGRDAIVSHNDFANIGSDDATDSGHLSIGVENTGYAYTEISYNSFRDFRTGRTWSPIVTDNNTAGSPRSRYNKIIGNRTIEPANLSSTFYSIDNSYMQDNYFETISGSPAVVVRNAIGNKFFGEHYKSAHGITLQIGVAADDTASLPTYNNVFYASNFETTSAGITGVVYSDTDGASGVNEIIESNITKPNGVGSTGSYVAYSAQDPRRRSLRLDKVRMDGAQLQDGYYLWGISDATQTMPEIIAQQKEIHISNGTLTANRVIFVPAVRRKYTVYNGTNKSLIFDDSTTVATITVPPGTRKTFSFQTVSNSMFDWGSNIGGPVGTIKAPAVAITPGASPYVYTNATTVMQKVIVQGGTVSKIEFSRDSGTTYYDEGVLAGSFMLAPNDRIRITYSVAPTMSSFDFASIDGIKTLASNDNWNLSLVELCGAFALCQGLWP